MSQPDKPERAEVERPTEWPATVNTPYGPQENISEREYIDLERQGLVRPATDTEPAFQRTESSAPREAEASRKVAKSTGTSDSREN